MGKRRDGKKEKSDVEQNRGINRNDW